MSVPFRPVHSSFKIKKHNYRNGATEFEDLPIIRLTGVDQINLVAVDE